MATIRRFEDIISWQEARQLNRMLGELIREKRFEHNYALIHQMERSAGFIMDNIAEGFERGDNREFIQFLYIAKGSCGELRSQLYRAADRKYLNKDEFQILTRSCISVSTLINALIGYLQKSDIKGVKFKKATGS